MREQLWEPICKDQQMVDRALELAHRDLRAAREIKHEPDWVYSIAYNAVLSAGRAYMFSEGFRPIGPAKHVSVVQFLSESGIDVSRLNRMRRKRHQAVYEYAEIISPEVAEDALSTATRIVENIEQRITDGK